MTKTPWNRAAWDGEVPLVAPLPSPLEIGSVAFERNDEADHPDSRQERRGGVIVARRVDHETGEVSLVTILRGRMRQALFTVHRVDLDTADLDPALSAPAEVAKMHAVARMVCRHLGDHWRAGRFGHFDRWLLEVAGGLLVLADELAISQGEQAREAAERRAS